MSFYALLILAFGMSMDAFAASIGKGAALYRPPLREALRTGIIFGVVEAITPVIGWGIGLAASQYVLRWDHWIAFALLMLLGVRMVVEGMKKDGQEPVNAPRRHGFGYWSPPLSPPAWMLWLSAWAGFLEVNIVTTALLIGLATTIMATTGMLLGRFLGAAMGKWAEVMGGVVLIGIGCTILLEHLAVFA
jgi:putative Mn2+ efflux pump MntP